MPSFIRKSLALFLLAAVHVAAGDSASDPLPEKKASAVSVNQVQALVDAGKFAEAEKKARILSKTDKSPAVFTLLGFSLRKQKKNDDAIKAYRQALEMDGTYAQAKEYLGVAYLNKKETAKAKVLYDDLSHSDPKLAAMLKNEAAKVGVKW